MNSPQRFWLAAVLSVIAGGLFFTFIEITDVAFSEQKDHNFIWALGFGERHEPTGPNGEGELTRWCVCAAPGRDPNFAAILGLLLPALLLGGAGYLVMGYSGAAARRPPSAEA